jgi:hypothetical protein
MHVPTGLFAAFGTGEQDILGGQQGADNANNPAVVGALGDDIGEKSFWHVTAGVEKNFFGYGATTVFGEYGEYSDYQADLSGSEADVIGFGVNQTFDSAALDIYAQYRLYTFEDNRDDDDDVEEDISTILIGSRIKF